MRKLCLILLICTISSFAQSINSGIVVYEVKPSSKIVKGLSKKNRIYAEIKDAVNHLDQLQYNLYFNSEIAYYNIEEQLANERNPAVQNAAKLARNTPFYTLQPSGETFNKIEFMGDDYLIAHKCSDYNWEIQEETKIIQGYTCLRATSEIEGHNEETIEVVAYFCPQIPFNYGPKGYCGLPGMILCLEDDLVVYEMTEIQFEAIDAIEFDRKGIVKTKEGFSTYVDSLATATFGWGRN
ncbi:GLPGLI family protein [Leeuwenhoekiella aestuarii]|uniref:GLPGLI family protein n=1 Tax=Leeuwenhoekiella aestuarii TaxID=2249426 RepID=A0A4Q0NVG4_9FLAO|nr:GLPGLI family protein [Leeuwenhoekiella aestuarii]RXG14234.1 GLPGLI family protein [Leeuwenhoekiella aestuarii]RXG18983.1 GLPGLI family protein [Leeuwenhoekiella aestuarii]